MPLMHQDLQIRNVLVLVLKMSFKLKYTGNCETLNLGENLGPVKLGKRH